VTRTEKQNLFFERLWLAKEHPPALPTSHTYPFAEILMSHNALAPKEAMNGAPSIADRNECQEKKNDLKLDVNFGRAKTLVDNNA